MKKILWGTVLIIICTFFFVSKTSEYVYVNPRVNIKVLPYINKTIYKLNKGFNVAIKNCNLDGLKMKLIYKNAYGSGFLVNNPTPNDLDYSLGIHLGKYYYNGQNAKDIAQDIENKMSTFQSEFYNYINNEDDSLITNYGLLGSIIYQDKHKDKKIKSMTYSINQLFKNKDYIYFTDKQMPDKKDFVLRYPFILKSNEILVEENEPIQLFTRGIKYNKTQPDYLKEITIIIDYFADVENTKTKEIKKVEIVSESFTGQKLQLSRRFFVPIVFLDECSANYLKNLDYIKDDEKYIEYRLFNYRRYLQEFSNLKAMEDRPVKMLKRILQCAEIISPALSSDLKKDLYKIVSDNLYNKDMQAMNDYSNALGNLLQIMQLTRVYQISNKNGEIKILLKTMESSLNQLKSNPNINKSDIDALFKYQKEIETKLNEINSFDDFILASDFMAKKMEIYNNNIINIFSELLENKEKLYSYIEQFNRIYSQAGFHKVELYWLDDNTIGILEDSFTSTIPQEKLKKAALENNLIDVNYKLIKQKNTPKLGVRYSMWIRFNPSEVEEQNWNILKSKLLIDKNKYTIKRRIVMN